MITVCLHGGLSEYGRRFDLHVASPAEAVRALLSQLPNLREILQNGFYQVRFNRHDFSEAELETEFQQGGHGVLHIVPRIQGAGRVGQIVAGVALLVFAWWNPFGWTVGGALLTGISSLGMGLVLGGVAQLLTKTPKLDTEQRGQKAGRNTAFSNLDNTSAQGQPVPLCYGRAYCGSRVVSQGVVSRRVNTNGDPVLQNPEATDVNLRIEKTFITGRAAKAPNGQYYNTDFNDDSVRARNYTAVLQQV
jgi:bacteriophage lambda tail assembly protein I